MNNFQIRGLKARKELRDELQKRRMSRNYFKKHIVNQKLQMQKDNQITNDSNSNQKVASVIKKRSIIGNILYRLSEKV
jgi:hypothetical protein